MVTSDKLHPFDAGNQHIKLCDASGHIRAVIVPCDYDYTNGDWQPRLNCDLVSATGELLYCGISQTLLEALLTVFSPDSEGLPSV